VVGEWVEVKELELGIELLLQLVGVGHAESVGNDRSNVAKDRVTNLRLKLGEVLMREDEVHLVLPQFREHCGEAQGGEGRELVEGKVRVPARLLWGLGPAEAYHADQGHEKRPHEG